ncbi:MAG: glycosyltransferase [Candidatus Eremiobacteraeota bacterium]|nr:glycosyltransferase [Candidatus Eremiobacteraeota bacterium]
MKIMLAGAFPPQEKGEAAYLGSYASALRELDRARLVIVSQHEDRPWVDAWNGFTVHRCIRDRTKRPSYAPQRELVEAVRAHRPDVLHLHYGPNQDFGGRVGEPLIGALHTIRSLGVKTVVSLHSTWLPADVMQSAPARRMPSILRPLAARYFSYVTRALRRTSDDLLCVVAGEHSPMTAQFAAAYDIAVEEELFGCDVAAEPMPAHDDPLIFSFGFIRPEKGFEFLVEAFSRYAQSGGSGKLLIAGRPLNRDDRQYAQAIASAAAAAGKRVEFRTGFLPEEELHTLLKSASVLVLPYLRAVGPSAPMHMAIGMGRPVIATAVGHNRAADDAVTLVQAGSSEAIANALSRLLQNRGALVEAAERARNAARIRAWEHLAVRQTARYEQLASSMRGRRIA